VWQILWSISCSFFELKSFIGVLTEGGLKEE